IEQQVHARAFVIAASTCESARLLLNSRSSLFPDGLANSSGMVGRNLMDSVGSFGLGHFPQLEKMPPHNHDGSGGNFLPHVYIPWWKFNRKNEFLRGYHIEPGGGRFMPVVGEFDDICSNVEGYGISLKESCKRSYGTTIGLEGLGEMIPNENTYCEIDPDALDEWGIPTLRFIGVRAKTKSRWPRTCKIPAAPSLKRPGEPTRPRRLRTAQIPMAFTTAAWPFMSPGPCGWAPIPRALS